MRFFLLSILGLLVFCPALHNPAQAEGPTHALAISGTPKYGPDFTHFDYANPNAPKGGKLTMSSIGTYDSFNPFVPKGVPAVGLGMIYDTLLVKSDDEPFTEYGLLAKSMELAPDGLGITFHLRPEARFHDGARITAEDVVFTFNAIMEQGSPIYRNYYGDVTKVEALDEDSVHFSFKNNENKELPAILGQLTVLPKAWWKDRDFSAGTLDAPLGSGPYRIKEYSPGRSITYERVKDYWGKDLPVNKGQFNFDEIIYDYYRDATIALEAFKSGEYDIRIENVSKLWATAYTGPAVGNGLIVLEEIPHELPQGMQGFAYNLRRPLFADPLVRQALAYAFDFEWSNKNLFYDQYKRTRSYFSNSELASSSLPSAGELEILAPYRDKLPPEIFTQDYSPPSTKGEGGIRANLRTAAELLKKASWSIRQGKLVNEKSGEPFSFELLLSSSTMERVALPFQKNLERLGIAMSIRVVDSSQYVNRLRDFDFDMVVAVLPQSLSPGNEQRYFWTSQAADTPDTYNYMGIKNPIIDELVELVIAAPDRESLITRTRALDRVLLWGHYVIPHFHSDYHRVAHWDKFDRPKVTPKYDLGLFTWWVNPDKAKRISATQIGK